MGTTDCGRYPVESVAPSPSLPDLELSEPLGAGGFATVWRAIRSADGQQVAVKVCRRATRAAQSRTANEAEAMSRVGAPHAAELLGHHIDHPFPYLVMELIPGPTLAEILESADEPLELDRIKELGAAIVDSVARVHSVGLCHRDLKPENLMFRPGGRASIIDFGLAGPSVDPRTTADPAAPIASAGGTPEYIAPEQLRGDPTTPHSDIYALGVILYEMATLRTPFVGDVASVHYSHAALRPSPPSQHADLVADLEALILSCLAKSPSERPADVAAVGRALASCTGPRRRRTIADDAGEVDAAPAQKKPMVLLASTCALSALDAASLGERYRGFVVDVGPTGALLAFSGDDADPLAEARACGQELVDRGGSGTIHLASLWVAERPGAPPIVAGAAVVDTDAWRLDGGAGELAETEAVRALDSPGDTGDTEFVGRDRIIASALDALSNCVSGEIPTLFTVTGEPGAGKSRLCRELARLVRDWCPEARVLTVDALDLDPFEGGELLRDFAATNPVVVIVDDAHRASDALLDALEYATLAVESAPIWVAAVADPALTAARTGWGKRAGAHVHVELEPLAPASAMELLAQALRPAEYPPVDALARLAEWASGNPLSLITIARALARDGLVVRVAGSDRWQLDVAALDRLPASPVSVWGAERELAALPPELAALARTCALLPESFDRGAVDRVVATQQAERGGLHADTDIGLFQLVHRQLLTGDGADSYWFRRAVVRDAVASLVPPHEAKQIHAAALPLWSERRREHGSTKMVLTAIAHHATGVGDSQQAAAAHLALGDEARLCHVPVDAERHYTAALELADASDLATRLRAHLGRGQMRYRIDRSRQAVADLSRAEELAADTDQRDLQVRAILEQATAHDWLQDFTASARCASRALALVGDCEDVGLEAQCALARGRTAWRRERVDEAAELLATAAEGAAALGDHDTRVVALLLLGPALVRLGRLAEAEARFEEVMSLCEPANDRLHLCAAHGNRMFLWSARKRPDLARADLREAMRLARQVGHPGPERVATYNLAEDLYWSGEADDEALALAQQAEALARRFIDVPVAEDSLLVARVALSMSRRELAEKQLQWVREHVAPEMLSPSAALTARMVELAAANGAVADWEALCAQAEPMLAADDYLEFLFWRGTSALAGGADDDARACLAQAQQRVSACPLWRERVSRLASAIEEATP